MGLSERNKPPMGRTYLRLRYECTAGRLEVNGFWLASAVHNDHVNATLGLSPTKSSWAYRPTPPTPAEKRQRQPGRSSTPGKIATDCAASRRSRLFNKVAAVTPFPEGPVQARGPSVVLKRPNLKFTLSPPQNLPHAPSRTIQKSAR